MSNRLISLFAEFNHVEFFSPVSRWWCCALVSLPLTWQSFGPLDGGDDLSPPKSVQGGHKACGGVGDGAVVARVHDFRLDGLQQWQHGGDKPRHGLEHQWGLMLAGHEGRRLGWSLLHFQTDQLFIFACWNREEEKLLVITPGVVHHLGKYLYPKAMVCSCNITQWYNTQTNPHHHLPPLLKFPLWTFL